jgi:hypothetical protein
VLLFKNALVYNDRSNPIVAEAQVGFEWVRLHYRTTRTQGRDCLRHRPRRRPRKPLPSPERQELQEQIRLQNQKADQLVQYCKGLHNSLERADEQWAKICEEVTGHSRAPMPRRDMVQQQAPAAAASSTTWHRPGTTWHRPGTTWHRGSAA